MHQLVMDENLTDIARRVALATVIDHAIADITGVPVETAADMQWAVNKAKELGYIPNTK